MLFLETELRITQSPANTNLVCEPINNCKLKHFKSFQLGTCGPVILIASEMETCDQTVSDNYIQY